MKLNPTIAAALLVASGFVASQAFAQGGAPTKAAEAQRLAQIKAQRDAKIAAAKARQNTIQRPTATPTPTVAPTVAPTATPTTTPTVTPTTTPTAVATTRPTATPTGAGGAAPTGTGGAASTGAGGAASISSATPTALPKPPPVLGLDLEELKKTRPDRRKVEFGQLQARWGELLRDQRAGSELKLHAQRTAYLQRIRALASKANDAKTVQAVDVLITKEDTRNADAMNALRSGALPIAAGAAEMNPRFVITALLLALASSSLGGCKFLKKKAPDDAAPTAAAAPSVAPAPPAPVAPPTLEAPVVAIAPPLDEATIPAPQDFEDEAFEKVTTANFKAELARLNKEITAPAPAAAR